MYSAVWRGSPVQDSILYKPCVSLKNDSSNVIEPRENKGTKRENHGVGWDMSIPLKLFLNALLYFLFDIYYTMGLTSHFSFLSRL